MLISIITVNFNNKDGLTETIQSVLKQLSANYEFLIIDGGSTDGALEVIKDNESKLSYWVSEKDNGPFHAMNKGIKKAKGEYCIFMNSGDSFYDEYVISKFCEQDRVKDIFVGTTYEHLGSEINVWNPVKESELCMRYLYRGSISHQGSFIKRKLLIELPYDENFRVVSDWKFYVEALILRNSSYEVLDFIVDNYVDGGISRDADLAFSEREKALESLFSPRIIRDINSMYFGVNKWDSLSKKVDEDSKIGKLIYVLTSILLKLRSLFNKN